MKRLEVFDAVPDALLAVGSEGTIVFANAAAAELFGYGREELDGLPIEALVPTRLRAEHAQVREAYARAPRDRPMGRGLDILARRKDGSEFVADVELRPRALREGRVVIAVVRNLTHPEQSDEDRLRLEERMQHARDLDRQMRLARLTIEDFSELLAAILVEANRAAAETLPESAAEVAIGEIRRTATLAAGLAEQLLELVEDAVRRGPAR